MSEEEVVVSEEAPLGVGPQLKAARERMGLSTADVAKETRISQRHIEAIEQGRFDQLPGRIYATGFAKTYAKLVHLDQADVAAMVRGELNDGEMATETRTSFEPGDPTRAPGRGLVWFSLFGVVLLLVGLFFAAREVFAPAAQMPSLIEQQEAQLAEERAAQAAAQAKAEEPIAASGAVTFTAQGAAWVRFVDGQGSILMEKELAQGDSYTLPADAADPKIITGRPDLLAITIGGREVPKLSDELVTLVDVPVDAASLLAREVVAPPVQEPVAQAPIPAE